MQFFRIQDCRGKSQQPHGRVSEDAGPDMTIDALMSVIAYFRITGSRAKEILSDVVQAVKGWRKTGQSIGMSEEELEPFVDAFEHGERAAANRLI